ncbi:MAG TPA: diacylglycerol kinase family protein [Pyrinomonadaceae bacterium]|nr:diacylglycerol kinase family protein [Pyrinomonadaceae bacterium]
MEKRIEVILNSKAGSAAADDLAETVAKLFRDHKLSPTIYRVQGAEIGERAVQAAKGDAEIIVAGGGDGTICGVATEVSKANKVLGVLPLGTLNHFSKDLGVPQDLGAAVAGIADGEEIAVDLGSINDQIFVNNSSIGLYPHVVKQREMQQHRLGRNKWHAALWAGLKSVWVTPFIKVKAVIDGKEYEAKTPFVFIGNNSYEMDLYDIGARKKMDGGKLCVYALTNGSRSGVFIMMAKTLTGRVKHWKDFKMLHVDSITLVTKRKKIAVARDGEVGYVHTPLEYKIVPRALRVLVPKRTAEAHA